MSNIQRSKPLVPERRFSGISTRATGTLFNQDVVAAEIERFNKIVPTLWEKVINRKVWKEVNNHRVQRIRTALDGIQGFLELDVSAHLRIVEDGLDKSVKVVKYVDFITTEFFRLIRVVHKRIAEGLEIMNANFDLHESNKDRAYADLLLDQIHQQVETLLIFLNETLEHLRTINRESLRTER